jgi:putative ABC transport system permease protein
MPLLSRLSSLWRNLFRKARKDRELTEEIDAYLEMLVEQKIKDGLDPTEARRAALIELGGREQVKEKVREVSAGHHLETLWQDVNYAARSLRKHALLSIIVIATLTLGIGVSAGVFAFYNAELLRARVDKDHDSFVKVYSAYTNDPTRAVRPRNTTMEDYLAFRDRAKSLGDLVAWAQVEAPFGQNDLVVARASLVTCNFFSLYDPGQPLLGRLLQQEDCSVASPVVVMSERLWRNRFAADPQIVGKVVHFNGQPVTVVGVTPNFAGMVQGTRAWFPYTLETSLKLSDNLLRPGEAAWLEVEGRLNPGFSRKDAAAELYLLAGQQDRLHSGRTTRLAVTDGSPIQEPVDGKRLIWAVALILGVLTVFVLIVCVNVTTLLLSRAAKRRQEVAVRLALGAGRWRLVRLLLTETFLLASLAGLASLYLAYRMPGILLHWLVNPLGESGGTWWSLAPDWRVFGYLTLVTVLAGTIAGLTPAIQSLKVNLSEALKGRPGTPGGGLKGSRLYGLLIGAQVGLSFFLLFGAGLTARIYQNAATFEPGFETRQVLWARVTMRSRSSEPRSWGAFHQALPERLTALPGAQSVAYSFHHPFNDSNITEVQTQGQAMRQVAINWVSSNYFLTLGIPILSGRALRDGDPPCVQASGNIGCPVVVSQQLVREFWPDQNPLGQTIRTRQGNSLEVVGVARDISSAKLGGPDGPIIYQTLNPNASYPANAFVRFSGDEAAIARSVTTTIQGMAPELSVRAQTIQSLREHLMETMGRGTQLIVFLCAIAVILAVIGIYGVVSFAVTQRTKELGIRIALGARPTDIYRAVFWSSGRPVAVGLLIGLALTVAVSSAAAPLLRNIEFVVNVHDPAIYAVIAILLAGVALAAMLGPARRATRVDPMMALRDE